MLASAKKLRLDSYLRQVLPQLSRRHVEEALEQAWVRHASGRVLKKGEKVNPAEDVNLAPLLLKLEQLEKGTAIPEIKVVAEREDYLIIDKPAGIPSHPLSLLENRTVTHWAFHRYPEIRNEFRDAQPTLTPHRLDTGTSGLLIVAKTQAAYERWRQWFSEHQIEKSYLAWVWGVPDWKELGLTHKCGHSAKDDKRMVIKGSKEPIRGEYQKAETYLLRRNSREGKSLIQAVCRTGVMHQVRVQLAYEGFPLVGDAVYDKEDRNEPFSHHLLRAFRLRTPDGEWEVPTENFEHFVI